MTGEGSENRFQIHFLRYKMSFDYFIVVGTKQTLTCHSHEGRISNYPLPQPLSKGEGSEYRFQIHFLLYNWDLLFFVIGTKPPVTCHCEARSNPIKRF
jgi:hypothetical protein